VAERIDTAVNADEKFLLSSPVMTSDIKIVLDIVAGVLKRNCPTNFEAL
jgi:hypothetical protein